MMASFVGGRSDACYWEGILDRQALVYTFSLP